MSFILESEGVRAADINVAEGKRQARILASEAEKQEQINKALGEAQGMLAVAEARAKGLRMVGSALCNTEMKHAASLTLAEQYVSAFNKLARTNNTLILPANAGDVSSLVAQAMSIYSTVSAQNLQAVSSQPQTDASDVQFEEPLVKITALSEKGTTMAGQPVSDDNLEEYYSDDDERAKALEKRRKEQHLQKKELDRE
ncbi:stomatin-like protein 2, mitochondrial [Phthorimaea operculella]|nr:stomatin-like protein 2, mitochondrial [Phthorimaea operculella]